MTEGIEKRLLDAIRARAARAGRTYRFMEVCGTHTMAAARSGIHRALPENVRLISGPGCPVCVTPADYVKRAIHLAEHHDVTLLTFGDMLRVPAKADSLEMLRGRGGKVKIVMGPFDALKAAQADPATQFVFLAVGFETTACGTAAMLKAAHSARVQNLAVLSAQRLIPPAMDALLSGGVQVDGFLCPGHVSTVIGLRPYRGLADKYGLPFVVAGFAPADILAGVDMLIDLSAKGGAVGNVYPEAVKEEGNPTALALMAEVYDTVDAAWRGLGVIPVSGLVPKRAYSVFEAALRFKVPDFKSPEPKGCKCGAVLAGRINPPECPLFAKTCTPERPVGPCMVSSEGSCAAHYRYNRTSR